MFAVFFYILYELSRGFNSYEATDKSGAAKIGRLDSICEIR